MGPISRGIRQGAQRGARRVIDVREVKSSRGPFGKGHDGFLDLGLGPRRVDDLSQPLDFRWGQRRTE